MSGGGAAQRLHPLRGVEGVFSVEEGWRERTERAQHSPSEWQWWLWQRLRLMLLLLLLLLALRMATAAEEGTMLSKAEDVRECGTGDAHRKQTNLQVRATAKKTRQTNRAKRRLGKNGRLGNQRTLWSKKKATNPLQNSRRPDAHIEGGRRHTRKQRLKSSTLARMERGSRQQSLTSGETV